MVLFYDCVAALRNSSRKRGSWWTSKVSFPLSAFRIEYLVQDPGFGPRSDYERSFWDKMWVYRFTPWRFAGTKIEQILEPARNKTLYRVWIQINGPQSWVAQRGLIMIFEQRLLKVSQSSIWLLRRTPPEQSLDPFQMLSHQNADRSYHLLAYFNHSFKRTLLFPSLNHSGASSASCALLCIALGICSSSPTWLQHLAHGYHHQWWGWLRHGLSVKFLGYSNCHFFWQFLNITLW